MRILAGLLVLAGCAASDGGAGLVPLNAPDGSTYYRVKCSGTEQKCLAAANQTCAGPYQVITSESHAGGLVADVLPGPVTWYSMHFQCGPTDGVIPAFRPNGATFAQAWEGYLNRQAYLQGIREANRNKTIVCYDGGPTVTCTVN